MHDRLADRDEAATPQRAPEDPAAQAPPRWELAGVGNSVLARAILARNPEADRVKKLNETYEAAVAKPDRAAAAEALNGFSRADIVSRLGKRTAAEITLLHGGAVSNPRVGPQSQLALLTPPLLASFAATFRDSAQVILGSEEAMVLVREADAAAVAFGGYAEDGPGKSAWPYTIGNTVYVPKAHTDKVVAMDDFLYELNNALRKPKFAGIEKDAAGGKLDAKAYARRTVEQEVEGMLRMGKVWTATKKTMGGGKELDKYDAENYVAEYTAVQAGKKTKDDIVDDVLKRTYAEGSDKGKTVEQFYMEQYTSNYGKKAP